MALGESACGIKRICFRTADRCNGEGAAEECHVPGSSSPLYDG